MCVHVCSVVSDSVTPSTVAHQVPLSGGFPIHPGACSACRSPHFLLPRRPGAPHLRACDRAPASSALQSSPDSASPGSQGLKGRRGRGGRVEPSKSRGSRLGKVGSSAALPYSNPLHIGPGQTHLPAYSVPIL